MEKRSCCCSGEDGAMNINMETGEEAAENAAAADAGTDDAVCHCRHKHRTEKEEKDLTEAIQCRLHRRYLDQDIRAVALVLDHGFDAADLSFDPAQTV